MKKNILILFALFNQAFAEEDLSSKVKDLEKRIEKLENLISKKSKPLVQEVANDKNVSQLSLKSWSFKVRKERSSEYYSITHLITNDYKKGIKLLDASIQFYDLLGERVYGIGLDKDSKIKSGEIFTSTGDYSINPYINKDHRMKKMDKADIVAKLKVRKIVFDDNTTIDFTEK